MMSGGKHKVEIEIETHLTNDVGWTASVDGYWCIEGCHSEHLVLQAARQYIKDALLPERNN